MHLRKRFSDAVMTIQNTRNEGLVEKHYYSEYNKKLRNKYKKWETTIFIKEGVRINDPGPLFRPQFSGELEIDFRENSGRVPVFASGCQYFRNKLFSTIQHCPSISAVLRIINMHSLRNLSILSFIKSLSRQKIFPTMLCYVISDPLGVLYLSCNCISKTTRTLENWIQYLIIRHNSIVSSNSKLYVSKDFVCVGNIFVIDRLFLNNSNMYLYLKRIVLQKISFFRGWRWESSLSA